MRLKFLILTAYYFTVSFAVILFDYFFAAFFYFFSGKILNPRLMSQKIQDSYPTVYFAQEGINKIPFLRSLSLI